MDFADLGAFEHEERRALLHPLAEIHPKLANDAGHQRADVCQLVAVVVDSRRAAHAGADARLSCRHRLDARCLLDLRRAKADLRPDNDPAAPRRAGRSAAKVGKRSVGLADRAERLGKAMLLAPVPLGLEDLRQGGIALRTKLPGHAVLSTPAVRRRGQRRRRRRRCRSRGSRCAVAVAAGEPDEQCQNRRSDTVAVHAHCPAAFGGRSIFKLGLQMRHCDSGRACSWHQSPVALNAGINEALQRVHSDSGTWWPPHQSSWEPGFAPAAACAAGPPDAGPLAAPGAAFGPGSLAASLLSQLVAPRTRITKNILGTTRIKSPFLPLCLQRSVAPYRGRGETGSAPPPSARPATGVVRHAAPRDQRHGRPHDLRFGRSKSSQSAGTARNGEARTNATADALLSSADSTPNADPVQFDERGGRYTPTAAPGGQARCVAATVSELYDARTLGAVRGMMASRVPEQQPHSGQSSGQSSSVGPQLCESASLASSWWRSPSSSAARGPSQGHEAAQVSADATDTPMPMAPTSIDTISSHATAACRRNTKCRRRCLNAVRLADASELSSVHAITPLAARISRPEGRNGARIGSRLRVGASLPSGPCCLASHSSSAARWWWLARAAWSPST